MLGSKPSSRMGIQWEGHCKQGDGRHRSGCAVRTAGDPAQDFGVSGLIFSYNGGSGFWTKCFSSLLSSSSLSFPFSSLPLSFPFFFWHQSLFVQPDCYGPCYIANVGLTFLGLYPWAITVNCHIHFLFFTCGLCPKPLPYFSPNPSSCLSHVCTLKELLLPQFLDLVGISW